MLEFKGSYAWCFLTDPKEISPCEFIERLNQVMLGHIKCDSTLRLEESDVPMSRRDKTIVWHRKLHIPGACSPGYLSLRKGLAPRYRISLVESLDETPDLKSRQLFLMSCLKSGVLDVYQDGWLERQYGSQSMLVLSYWIEKQPLELDLRCEKIVQKARVRRKTQRIEDVRMSDLKKVFKDGRDLLTEILN